MQQFVDLLLAFGLNLAYLSRQIKRLNRLLTDISIMGIREEP